MHPDAPRWRLDRGAAGGADIPGVNLGELPRGGERAGECPCSPARARGYECVSGMMGRTSMHPKGAGGIPATRMASFRSLASIR